MITPEPRLRLGAARWFAFALTLLVALATCVPQLLAAAPEPAAPEPTASQKGEKPYALIAGTVWSPDNHPVYGVKVKIRRASDKPNKVRWELYSDHMGEFAQRVPAGEQDYIISADLKGLKMPDGTPLRLEKEVTVHIYNDERQETGLHLTY